ncbi:MAG TPA: glycosyltransferase [Isosphaeraceae bacterium]|jgi:glycosyltransferase involved in cell wall biosynthesis|nr:glycosyltransferase [Isosphaeraceae bacterium]
MNVLHVGIGNLFGGVETFLVSLGRRRDLWGPARHRFALCVEGRFSRELAEHEVPVTLLGATRVSRPWTVLRARRRLADLIRNGPGFDVAICHASWPQAVFGPVVRDAGLPLVFYLHGPTGGGHWTDRWAARTPPDLMIGVSRHTVETGRRIFPNCPAEVLNYPIPWPDADTDDPAVRAEVRTELGASPDDTVIMQASRMEPWKGTDQHLRALALIRDLPGWTCWIAGGSQRPYERRYREELGRLVEELGVADRVRFLGERRDVPRLLAAADILCQANRGPEGFSLAFMEAFHAGLPIVTIAMGGAPELIDETCGVLAPPGDIDAVADGLRKLIVDTDLRRRMGAAARRRVWETSDPATQLGRLVDLLASVIPRAVAG